MPNMYNTPIQGTPTNNYVSQHTDLPLDTLERALELRQAGYDNTENMGIAERTRLGGMQAIGDWADKTLSSKEKDLEDFTKQYEGKDLGSGEVTKAFKQKISDLAADKDLQNIQSFSSQYKEYQANREAMKKSGDFYDENDWHNQKALQNYSQTGDSSGFNSVIDKGVNIHEEAEKYFKALGPDSVEQMRSISDGQGGSVYYDNKSGGISAGKIQGQAGRVFHEFETSQAGKQATRRYVMEMEQAGKQPTSAGQQQYLAKLLLNAGAGFEQHSSSSGLSAALNTAQAKKDKKKEDAATFNMPFSEVASLAPNIEIDSKTGLAKNHGGAIDAFNETYKNTGSLKEALSVFKNTLTGDTPTPQTEADRKAVAPTMDSYKYFSQQRVKEGKQPYDLKQWLAKYPELTKRQQVNIDIPLKKSDQEGYENFLVANRGMLGLRVMDASNPAQSMTGDEALRLALHKKPGDEITTEEMKNAVQIVGKPSDSSYALDGVGMVIGGKPFIADAGSSKLLRDYTASSPDEMARINQHGEEQAKLKGGTNVYWGYRKVGNKYERIRVKARYDLMTGKVTKELANDNE